MSRPLYLSGPSRNFGLRTGDIGPVTTLTWKLYKNCKESSEDSDFRPMSTELLSLYAVLGETGDHIEEHGEELEDSRKHRLSILIAGCQGSLQDLDALYSRYHSMGTQAQRTWNRIHFSLKDLSDIRERLVSCITLLTSFNTALLNSSATRIEEKLNKFIAEVQAGMREGSVMSAGSRSPTPINDVEQDSNSYPTHTNSDLSSHDSSEGNTVGHRREVMSAAAINTSDAEAELLDSLAASTDSLLTPFSSSQTLPQPVVLGRRTFGLVEKLFQNRTAIVDAASDGDIYRVARLLSLGMDVNAVDRWGWSALSMCGYGGYGAIARLLLDHGAHIDNIDVDGDTPKSLAAQRGHADLVIMLEEEEVIRKSRASEANQ
ncbi:hypothetical protein DFH07DRAFT_744553 [Mycena maculata]|uniref:Ankyrin n=1 Tax=Mycena maculata TaxID=230809 RepID=A0AAD7IYL8_9AGAR|nr:hypothetical protein DFH07DRAFT_744553 [Mycena maculata]